MDDTLQRKTHNAFASLCVSIKAILTASSRTRREVFFFVPIAEWRENMGAPHFIVALHGVPQQNGGEEKEQEMNMIKNAIKLRLSMVLITLLSLFDLTSKII